MLAALLKKMINPNIKPPEQKTIRGISGLFYNFRDKNGISRWKVEKKCKVCGKKYWLKSPAIYQKKTKMCKECAVKRLKASGKNHLGYKGGRRKRQDGYIDVLLEKGDRFLCMATTGNYVAEHRLVMAKSLVRPLTDIEHVHHINGKKDDNRIENLELLGDMTHQLVTKLERKIKKLEREIKKLKGKTL